MASPNFPYYQVSSVNKIIENDKTNNCELNQQNPPNVQLINQAACTYMGGKDLLPQKGKTKKPQLILPFQETPEIDLSCGRTYLPPLYPVFACCSRFLLVSTSGVCESTILSIVLLSNKQLVMTLPCVEYFLLKIHRPHNTLAHYLEHRFTIVLPHLK